MWFNKTKIIFKLLTNKILTKIIKFLKTNDVEIVMLIGIFFISFATYKVNFIAFLYLIGIIFIILSLFLIKYPKEKE